MRRVTLVRTLKGVVVFLAALAALFYGFVFPDLIGEMGAMWEGTFAWLVTPAIVAVSLSAVPIAVALALFWQICTDIGRDNSFCHKNAWRLSGIGFCALADTAYCVVGTVTVFAITGGNPGVLLLAMTAIFGGLAIALAAFLLSHLVLKAAELKDEHDLTV